MSKHFSFFFALLLCFPSNLLHAQYDWLQGWRDATVAIGVVDTGRAVSRQTGKFITKPNGDTVRVPYFRIVGTGVICALADTDIHIPLLLTAKHVFSEPNKKWDPSSVRLRFSWFADKSVSEYLGIEFPLKDSRANPLWLSHPDNAVDLAVIPLRVSIQDAGRSSIAPVRIENFANENEAFEGASVLILGYPGAVGPDYWTKPLIRHGVIAHVDTKNFGEAPFLIDAMIFPGNSGGPVFIVPTGMTKNGSFAVGGRSAFLGIVSSVAREPVEVQKASLEFEASDVDSTGSHFKTFDYMGIGVIEAAGRVKELLESIRTH